MRLDPDLLAEIEAIVAADPTVTLTAILEDGARLWLTRYRRQKAKEKIDT
ncbi:MAG: hypothetical protein FD176_156 [Rhodospirillaceae bacterium]|nr:MAG: hypothetical protein FD176_156 [Rhodospirillaceae bacterium]TNC98674.1 MAG: hypothetical protein FD119_145 [Stygiobacter sp.]